MAANTNDIIEKLIDKLCSIGSPDALSQASHLAECLLEAEVKQTNTVTHNAVNNAYKSVIEDAIRRGNEIIDRAVASRNIVNRNSLG